MKRQAKRKEQQEKTWKKGQQKQNKKK